MPAVAEVMQTIHENKARDFEMNRRFEEMTDLAERIGYPIDTTINYDLRGESLYARTDTRQRAFIEQTYQAKMEAPDIFVGDQAFEVVRRSHEHDEALMVEQLARRQLDGNVLIKISKVPDAVVTGTTTIRGYKRESLRTFVRMYHVEGTTVQCRLFSLDQNNTEGFKRIESLIGMKLTGRSSEDILADSVLFDVDEPEAFVDQLADRSIGLYDDAMFEQTGRRTYAGSRYETHQNAQRIVENQTHLLQEHFDAISAIAGLGLNERAAEDLYENERQRTAAAIALVARGEIVMSTGDGAVTAEVANGDYGRECATGSENGMQQGQPDGKEIEMTCPHCGLTTVGDPCAFRLVCQKCDAEVRGGKLMSKGIGRSAALARMKESEQASNTYAKESSSKSIDTYSSESLVKLVYGDDAIIESRYVVGGILYDVKNKRTNELIKTISGNLA